MPNMELSAVIKALKIFTRANEASLQDQADDSAYHKWSSWEIEYLIQEAVEIEKPIDAPQILMQIKHYSKSSTVKFLEEAIKATATKIEEIRQYQIQKCHVIEFSYQLPASKCLPQPFLLEETEREKCDRIAHTVTHDYKGNSVNICALQAKSILYSSPYDAQRINPSPLELFKSAIETEYSESGNGSERALVTFEELSIRFTEELQKVLAFFRQLLKLLKQKNFQTFESIFIKPAIPPFALRTAFTPPGIAAA